MTKEEIMEELTNLISIGGNILTTKHETKYTGTCAYPNSIFLYCIIMAE